MTESPVVESPAGAEPAQGAAEESRVAQAPSEPDPSAPDDTGAEPTPEGPAGQPLAGSVSVPAGTLTDTAQPDGVTTASAPENAAGRPAPVAEDLPAGTSDRTVSPAAGKSAVEELEQPAPEPTAEELAAAEAKRAVVEQAAADLAEVKQWAAERAAAERAAAEAAERAAAAQATADAAELERAAAEQAAADLAAVREWAAQRAAAEQAAAEQAAAERAALERAEAARAEAERLAAEQAEAERQAVERAEAERLAAERAAAERVEAERAAAAAEMAAERAAIEQEAAARVAAAQKAAAERADVERAQTEWAASRQAAVDRTAAVERTAAGDSPATDRWGEGEPAAGRGGRLAKVLVAAVLVLVLVAAGVVLTLRLTSRDSTVAEGAEQMPDAVLPQLSDPGPVLAELSADAPVPDPDALAAVLAPLLAAPALGSGLSAEVVDVATGQVLFDRDALDPGIPASTAKLLTSVAALTTLGPTDTLTTTVVAGSAPGEVVLVGGGDPTLSTTAPSVDYPGAATVADLAAQVQQALAGQPVTRVVVDNSLFTGPLTAPGWGPDDAPSSYAAPVTAAAVDGARVTPGQNQRSGSPGTDAGRALARALGAPGAAVTLGAAPAGARTLGSVQSAPVVRLVEEALTASDNLLAESLARQVAIARGLPASFDGASDAITAALSEAGLETTGLSLFDGSGLSQDDRVPARLLVDVVQGAADGTLAHTDGLLTGLPVAGYDGTLAERAVAQGDAAPGSVRAKTGTLLGVNDLAGTVLTADGRLLAFAVLADGATGSVAATEAALDVIADALAGCGCR